MAKYLKPDSVQGYIEDVAEIKYQKFQNLRHTVLGFMWGDFDSNGKYVIPPEIVRELIAIKKYFVERMDNIEICQSAVRFDRQITFFVTLEGNRATLSLVEKINYEANFRLNSGAYSNINEIILDEVETSGAVDINLLYKRWNISAYGGDVLDAFHMDEETLALYTNLVNRFKYLMKANELLLDREADTEEIEAEYAVEIMNALKSYPKLKKAVDEEMKRVLSERVDFVCLDRPNFAKTINEVINNAIEKNIEELSAQEKQSFEVDKRNILNNYNIKMEESVEVKVDTLAVEAEQVGSQIEAERIDRYLIDTHNAEENETVLETGQSLARSTKRADARLEEEATAIVTGEVDTVSVEEKGVSSDQLDSILSAGEISKTKQGQKGEITLRKKTNRELLFELIEGRGVKRENILTEKAEKNIQAFRDRKVEAEKKNAADMTAGQQAEKKDSAEVKPASKGAAKKGPAVNYRFTDPSKLYKAEKPKKEDKKSASSKSSPHSAGVDSVPNPQQVQSEKGTQEPSLIEEMSKARQKRNERYRRQNRTNSNRVVVNADENATLVMQDAIRAIQETNAVTAENQSVLDIENGTRVETQSGQEVKSMI